jgi:hypothetical protein
MAEIRRYDPRFLYRSLAVTILIALVGLALVRLSARFGTAPSLRELKEHVEVGHGLDEFPFISAIQWRETTIRQRQVRLTGKVDVAAFHTWAFGSGRSPDVGVDIITKPHIDWAIGEKIGDRYYETTRTSPGLDSSIRVLGDGRYLIMIFQRAKGNQDFTENP